MDSLFKQIRKSYGVSLSEISKNTGIHRRTLENWEHDKAKPCPPLLIKLIDKYKQFEVIELVQEGEKKLLAIRFKYIRKHHNFSQEQLANQLQISLTCVRTIEACKHPPRRGTLEHIQDKLIALEHPNIGLVKSKVIGQLAK